MQYINCLRQHSSTSTPCRVLSKDYLDCRMNKCVYLRDDKYHGLSHDGSGLMERDEWKNLGLANLEENGTSKVENDNGPKNS